MDRRRHHRIPWPSGLPSPCSYQRPHLTKNRGLASQHLPRPSSSTPSNKRPPPPPSTPSPDDLLRFRKFRAAVWAGGFAVIVICGTLIGAQWKSYEQQKEALEIRALASSSQQQQQQEQDTNANATATDNKKKAETSSAATAAAAVIAPHQRKAVVKEEEELSAGGGGVTEADLNRSILTLSNLRGQLMMRKQQEEQRMDTLVRQIREKAEKAEREGRAGVVGAVASGK
jgi:hypothetical protein